QTLHEIFAFLPDWLENIVVVIAGEFVGEGWHLTLGLLFMIVVIFLPGGVVEGIRRASAYTRKLFNKSETDESALSAEKE
ncbi:MAG: branched-chain amino acid ABC transporter permease, partial [Sedimenticola sp.]|nr:branched-chain amino acid ABC transporter permease [Sedimenticola sp.]